MEDNIYMLRVYGKNESLIKVGYSSKIENRIEMYKAHNPLCEVVKTFYIEEGEIFEKKFHSLYPSELKNEWYKEELLDEILDFIENQSKMNNVGEDFIKESTFKNFKGYCLAVKDIMENNKESELDKYIIDKAFIKYSFLKRAIEILGFDGIMLTNYNTAKIKDKLLRRSDIGLEAKIIKALDDRFKPVNGDFYKSVELKEIFRKIYTLLEIPKTAKGTDIETYYDTKETTQRVEGKPVKGYIILGKN